MMHLPSAGSDVFYLQMKRRVFAIFIYFLYAYFRAGILNATIPLKLSLYLLRERDYVPWATALEHFQAWSKSLAESSAYKLFFDYLRHLYAPVAKYIGWDDTGSHLLKSVILTHFPSF